MERDCPQIEEGIEVIYLLHELSWYAEIKHWLKKGKERRLIFYEDNEELLESYINDPLFQDLQNDPQVFLASPFNLGHFHIKTLFAPYQILRREPSLVEETLIRDRRDLFLFASDYRNLGCDLLKNVYQNLTQNRPFIPLPSQGLNYSAILCGNGPSLQKEIPLLQELSQHALVVACGSSLADLPFAHVTVQIDPGPLTTSPAFDGPLICASRVCSHFFKSHPGIKILAKTFSPLGIEDALLPLDIERIDGGWNSLNFAISALYRMGCRHMILVGADHEDPERVSEEDLKGSLTWISRFQRENPDLQLMNSTSEGRKIDGIENRKLGSIELKKTFTIQIAWDSFLAVQPVKQPQIEIQRLKEEFDEALQLLEEGERGEIELSVHPMYDRLLRPLWDIWKDPFERRADHEQDLRIQRLLFYKRCLKEHRAMIPSRFYSDEGVLLSESFFNSEGKRDGVMRRFYLSGAIYAEENYKNGELEGAQTYYYEDGTIKTLLNYKRGVLEGEAKLYLENGEIKRVAGYKEGVLLANI